MILSSTSIPLHAPIETLNFSERFLKLCKRRKYRHLNDILAIGSDQLIADPSIDLAWFSELTAFLRSNFLLYLLDSKAK